MLELRIQYPTVAALSADSPTPVGLAAQGTTLRGQDADIAAAEQATAAANQAAQYASETAADIRRRADAGEFDGATGPKDPQGLPARDGQRETPVILAHRELPERRGLKVWQAQRGPRERKVRRGKLVPVVRLARRGQRARPVQQAPKVHRATRGRKVRPVRRDRRGTRRRQAWTTTPRRSGASSSATC